MRSLRLHFILVAFCAAVCLIEGNVKTLEKCGLSAPSGNIQGIIRGKTVSSGKYPWMVGLLKRGVHNCGGSIINENWVLTAAHCFSSTKKAEDFSIFVGGNKMKLRRPGKGEVYKVSKIIIHKDYDSGTYVNDIALIRTAKPINISELVNGICLPPKDEEPTGKAIVAGWGRTKYDGKGSDELLDAEVPLRPRGTCVKIYGKNHPTPNTMLCAAGEGQGSCKGDSGGPVIQRNSEGRYTLIGIVSNSIRCGTTKPAFPSRYTKVSAFIDWMDANMKE